MFRDDSFYMGWFMGSTFGDAGGIEELIFMIVLAILFFVCLFAFITIAKYYGVYVLGAVILTWIVCFIKGNDIIAKGDKKKGTRLKYHIPIGLIFILYCGTFFLEPIPSHPSTVTTIKFEQIYESKNAFYFYGSENNEFNKNVVAKSGISLLEIREPASDDETRFLFIPSEYIISEGMYEIDNTIYFYGNENDELNINEEIKRNTMIIYMPSDEAIKSYNKDIVPKSCSDLASNCE